MKIVKEYNLLELSSVIKRAIEYSHKADIKGASIDIIKAQEIVEVLERMAELEGIQKEAEGYIGEYGCVGHYNRSDTECLECDVRKRCKEIKNNDLEDNRKCFGACVKDDYICSHCIDYEKCLEETECEWEEEDDIL